MVMNKFYILLLIIFTAFTAHDVRKEIITIDWYPSAEEHNQLGYTFINAGYSHTGSQLPLFFKSVNLENRVTDYQFVIENPVFETKEIGFSDVHLPEFPEYPEIKKSRLRSGNTEWIEIRIPAAIYKNGKIHLLKKFELKQIPVSLKSAKTAMHNWKSESVLSSGKWVKISTTAKGIYKIPYSKLTGWGFSNPTQVKVFGAGGVILSEDPGKIEYDDLPQVAVWHGKNKNTDCLFFYVPGLTEWKPDLNKEYFEHRRNPYATKGFFFLSENAGVSKNVEMFQETEEMPTHSITTFDDYALNKTERYNLLQSGKQWFGEKYINGTTRNYTFQLSEIDNISEMSLRINAAARSSSESELTVSTNQTDIGKLTFTKVNTSDPTGLYADERTSRFTFLQQSGNPEVIVKYFGGGSNPESWLGFLELNFRRKLVKSSNEPLFFRDLNSFGEGKTLEFNIETTHSNLKVWDVTNIFSVKEIPLRFAANRATGIRPATELREYVAFSPDDDLPEPELTGEVQNQNLHALSTPRFLIISHPNFLNQANALADFHRNYDAMQVEVVSSELVYNEFSSGNKDATGIRNFIKMFYDRNEGLKYVLLFGDGSYDNKGIILGSSGFIPTFQSENSLSPVASFVTDDYYGILDAGESVYNGAIDLGIGRIPASTTFEAEIVVKKIYDYHSPEALGNWRNIVCFIADDEDGNLHMSDSEKLTNYLNENHNEFITDKIYFDAFQQITGPGGESYPGVTDAINQRVKDGVLVLNYVGHANERFIADERVLDISHINSWSNAKLLPIFVTATCEFSRFDADEASAGEYVLFNPNGGGIGLFSTTRLVFAYSNYLLSRSFYNFVFDKDQNGEHYRMGDIMRLAKINTINTINKRNFSLLADPALKLSYPQYKVTTTAVNGKDATFSTDTVGAMQKVTVAGFISDEFGNKISNFNGKIIPTVYDKAVMMKTRGNAGHNPFSFKVQDNIIYKGLEEVNSGEFSFSFVIPKDISYSIGKGKIMYYAYTGETDAHGAFENLMIGGPGSQLSDEKGPEIELYLDTPEFKPGDKVSKNPTLIAFLSDENGINTAGTGIGHDITAVLNDDYSNAMVLNNFYQSNAGDFTSGTVRYPLKNLPVGKHTLKLKAWDVANNSAEAEIDFEVTGEFLILQAKNYPNPVFDHTFFEFEHNLSDASFDAIFEIFNQDGRRIDYFSARVGSNGNISNPVRWDLSSAKIQMRSGIYLYRITAQNIDGIITSGSGKLIVAR
jgi:hypothetical protein